MRRVNNIKFPHETNTTVHNHRQQKFRQHQLEDLLAILQFRSNRAAPPYMVREGEGTGALSARYQCALQDMAYESLLIILTTVKALPGLLFRSVPFVNLSAVGTFLI